MYKLNVIIILCLYIATILTNAAPLNNSQNSSSSLTARSAMPLDFNSKASIMHQKRGLINPKLDLSENELNKLQTNNRIIKRDPIDHTVDSLTNEPRFHIKRVQKKARRSIIRKLDDNSILFK
uniref:Calcium release-activated calcium channel protein 1 n=1 Tax=Anthurium amnicola TaxID=1678845 RepID=A0A1D1XGN3_9ARAE